MAEPVSAEEVAEAMYQMVAATYGKKNLKPMDLTKAMIEKFGPDRCDKAICKLALRVLIDPAGAFTATSAAATSRCRRRTARPREVPRDTMALLNKNPKAKPLVARPSGSGAGQVSSQRPVQAAKRPPCLVGCPSFNDVRGWLTIVAQRGKLGLGLPEALEAAWKIMVETNPVPAVMGRVCPAPCEDVCNRKEKDGAVSIKAAERWFGDWGLERSLPLPRAAKLAPRRGKIAVAGGGPAGLSSAYHLARRGHSVTLFEAAAAAGGLLRASVPASRLPLHVLAAEIARVLDLGVTFRLSTRLGDGVSLETLRAGFDAVCLALGEAAPDEAHEPGVFRVSPGGDVAAAAIENGRRTADEIDAHLSGVPLAAPAPGPTIGPGAGAA